MQKCSFQWQIKEYFIISWQHEICDDLTFTFHTIVNNAWYSNGGPMPIVFFPLYIFVTYSLPGGTLLMLLHKFQVKKGEKNNNAQLSRSHQKIFLKYQHNHHCPLGHDHSARLWIDTSVFSLRKGGWDSQEASRKCRQAITYSPSSTSSSSLGQSRPPGGKA